MKILQNILQMFLYYVLLIEIKIYINCVVKKKYRNMLFYIELTFPPPPLKAWYSVKKFQFSVSDFKCVFLETWFFFKVDVRLINILSVFGWFFEFFMNKFFIKNCEKKFSVNIRKCQNVQDLTKRFNLFIFFWFLYCFMLIWFMSGHNLKKKSIRRLSQSNAW